MVKFLKKIFYINKDPYMIEIVLKTFEYIWNGDFNLNFEICDCRCCLCFGFKSIGRMVGEIMRK